MVARIALLVIVVLGLCLVACNNAPKSTHEETSAALNEIRYMALGDSFTIGTGNDPQEAFPSRLAARWRDHGKKVTLQNLGVNGYTTDDVAARELPEVKAFRPTVVTLAVGANDRVRGTSVDVYRANVHAILSTIVDAGAPVHHLFTLPQPEWSLSPAAASFGDPQALGRDIVTFNDVLREETAKVGAVYLDLYPLMHRQAEMHMLAPDGLHPNARAHEEWAAALFEKIP